MTFEQKLSKVREGIKHHYNCGYKTTRCKNCPYFRSNSCLDKLLFDMLYIVDSIKNKKEG